MADIVTSRVFVDGEKGITAAKMNDIIGSSSIQTGFYSSKPTTNVLSSTDTLLALKSGAYAQIPYQTILDSINAGLSTNNSQIWDVRLRSYNAIGNPNFEVDQRNAGSGTTAVSGSSNFLMDRWQSPMVGAMAVSGGQGPGNILLPGTNYYITSKYLNLNLTGPSVLGASDYLSLYHVVEGSSARELLGDFHSLSLLVKSSVANLKFGVTLHDNPNTRSLSKLCTLGAAGVWTLVTLPNLPAFPGAGNFNINPGTAGYVLRIVLGAGTALLPPANDTWQTGSFFGAAGQSNWAASVVNSTFSVAFIQHEPGVNCSQLMDKPFDQNSEECQRQYQKTYDLATLPGTITSLGARTWITYLAGTTSFGPMAFNRRMAKAPTVSFYNPTTGVINSIRDGFGVNHVGASAANIGEAGFTHLTFTTATTGICETYGHYVSATGW